MIKNKLPKGFSLFTWGIAIFCAPVLLCPMALLLSTAFAKNPHLENWQINLFSTLFWIYPLILALVARILYRLHLSKPTLAAKLLFSSIIVFYIVLILICKIGFQ